MIELRRPRFATARTVFAVLLIAVVLAGCRVPKGEQGAYGSDYSGSWTANDPGPTTLPYFGLDVLNKDQIHLNTFDGGWIPGVTARMLSGYTEKGVVPADANGTTRDFDIEYSLFGDVSPTGEITGNLFYQSEQTLSNAEYGKYSKVTEDLKAEVTGTVKDGKLQLTARGGGPMEQTWMDTPVKTDDEVTQKSFVWTYAGDHVKRL